MFFRKSGPSQIEFHGLHDDLKIYKKRLSPGPYPVHKICQCKKRRHSHSLNSHRLVVNLNQIHCIQNFRLVRSGEIHLHVVSNSMSTLKVLMLQ